MRPGKPPAPVADRFWRLVDKSGDCWLWMGAKWKGYGQFGVQQSPGVWPLRKAHRVAYELIVGPIPDGMQLDHLCRNPSCVNPDHLEPVTNRENGAAMTVRKELVTLGLVRNSGRRAPSDTGTSSIVWALTAAGDAEIRGVA